MLEEAPLVGSWIVGGDEGGGGETLPSIIEGEVVGGKTSLGAWIGERRRGGGSGLLIPVGGKPFKLFCPSVAVSLPGWWFGGS